MDGKNAQRTAMIVSIQGGIGNQLFQYAFGRSVSIVRNEELFFTKAGCGGDREYSLDAFNVKIQWAEGRQPQRGEPVFRFDAGVYTEPRGLWYHGYWQTEKYFNVPVVREELRFKNMPTTIAIKWADKITTGKNAFIHVRRGDYLKEPHQSFHGNLSMQYYNEGIDRIKQVQPDAKFFIFSDDTEWCKSNFSKEYEVVEGTDRFEDMYLMSLCRHAVIANSSFSWWGAWLGDEKKDRVVIAPRKWFQSPSMSYDDVIPDRWVKL